MFTKWIKDRKADGPAKAMIASKRFAFDLTPEDVALAVANCAYAMEDSDGNDLDDLLNGSFDDLTGKWSLRSTPEEVRAFVAKHATKKQTEELLKATLFEFGLGENLYLTIVESRQISKEYITAIAQGLVDAFVDDDTIARLFGGAA